MFLFLLFYDFYELKLVVECVRELWVRMEGTVTNSKELSLHLSKEERKNYRNV
jgi:hypothetical protein